MTKRSQSKIIFTGTGSGKTSLKRFHSSFIIHTKNKKILVDAGDSISRALLNLKIPFNEIDGVIFSHFHADHYTGLPSLITQMKMNERKEDLYIYVEKDLKGFLKDFVEGSYLYSNRLGFNINYSTFQSGERCSINDVISFTPKKNSHLSSYAGSNERNKQSFSPPKVGAFSSSGFLFEISGKKIFYSGDVGSKDDLFLFADDTIDYFITETTHIEPELIYAVLLKIKPSKIFLTHIDEEDERKLKKFIKKLSAKEKKIVIPAYDGMKISL